MPARAQVEQYVCHSPITNSWCVQCGMQLEPGNVYSLLVVMAEGTPKSVPLRLTLYSPPEADDDVINFQPMSDKSEWHLTALSAPTDSNGMVTLAMSGAADAGNMQATLVAELEEQAFLSVSTLADAVPYKQTPTYAHKQAVLSVPLSGGTPYTMVTRAITQRQEPIRNSTVKFLLYSAKPLDLTSTADTTPFELDTKTMESMVCRANADQVVYGEECVPDDCVKKEEGGAAAEEENTDPVVLGMVMKQLEGQRNDLCAFAKADLKNEVPSHFEMQRAEREQLRAQVAELKTQVESANMRAAEMASGGAGAVGSPAGGGDSAKVRDLEAKLRASEAKEKELQAKVTQLSKPRDAKGDAAVAAKQLEDVTAQLQKAEAKAAQATKRMESVESKLGQGGGGGGAEVDALRKELNKSKEEAARYKHQAENAPKSAACLVM